MLEKPFFLVGAERSGTTLLRLMLDHHPQIACNYEFEYIVDLISDSGEFPDIKEFHEWLEINETFKDSNFLIDPNLNYAELVNSFLLQKEQKEQKELIGATVHRYFDKLLYIWPDARFIHLLRDGRDVARSCMGMGWAGNVWTGVERWIESEKLWETLSQNLPPDRFINIKYENLISDTVNTLTAICNFLGISYDSQMLSYAEKTTYDLPDSKLIQQWKNKLSDYEIQLLETKIGDMLLEGGYELSGLPRLEVNAMTQRNIKLQDWFFRVKFRLKRYGWKLFLADYISRKLQIQQWEKSVQSRIYDINKTHWR